MTFALTVQDIACRDEIRDLLIGAEKELDQALDEFYQNLDVAKARLQARVVAFNNQLRRMRNFAIYFGSRARIELAQQLNSKGLLWNTLIGV